MKLKIYSVKDVKAEEFGPLFLVKNDEVAKRSFTKQMEGQEYILEYDLYCVGSFDSESGKFTVPQEPILLMTGNEVFNSIMETAGDNAVKLRIKELGEHFKGLSKEEQERIIKEVKERGYKK